MNFCEAGQEADLSLAARAKINLHLAALGRRADGYTEIETIFQTVALSDYIRLRQRPAGIVIRCSDPSIPDGRGNLAYRAAAAFFDRSARLGGVDISIEKRIPVAAGLGGGSSDAAAVLKGLNMIHGLPLSSGELADLAGDLGSDVPFFLQGGTAVGKGRGEKLEPLPDLPPLAVVIIFPGVGISTAKAYGMLSRSGSRDCKEDLKIIVKHIEKGDIIGVKNHLRNDLEEGVLKAFPEVFDARLELGRTGADLAMMTGSGSACYGLYRSKERADEAARKLAADKRWMVFSTFFSGSEEE